MRISFLSVLLWIVHLSLHAQETERDHWNVLKSHPSANELARTVDAIEQDIRQGSRSGVENLLNYAAHIASDELNDYGLAARSLEILYVNQLTGNQLLPLMIGRNLTAELKSARSLEKAVYEEKMNRAVRYFSVYLETDPGSFDAHYTMAGLHYNYFAYLQANRLYHRDLNMRALTNAEASLRKALESDPGNTDALEFLQTVQDLAGSQVSKK